jgi:aminopeptidase N
LTVAIGSAAEERRIIVPLNGEQVEVADATGLPAPNYVLPAGGGWAYGLFRVDRGTLDYLSRSLSDIADPISRGSAWVTVWDAMLEKALSPTVLVDLAASALPRETDEQLTARVLGYLGNAWWRFLTPDERGARVSALELLLGEGLARAKTASQKAAWFNALRDIAVTPETVAWLQRIWAQQERVPGLPLAEPDYIALALHLAVREVSGWRDLLQVQLTHIENPDRKARFQFVMPALSADVDERDRWFQSLKDLQNRRREPWVLEGLSYLHHPLRAAASAKYVGVSLAMLQEIQRTGDIFFPKRWLDATLGGHSSRAVADQVRTFIGQLPPDYPPRLKNITLQSADELFRAAK